MINNNIANHIKLIDMRIRSFIDALFPIPMLQRGSIYPFSKATSTWVPSPWKPELKKNAWQSVIPAKPRYPSWSLSNEAGRDPGSDGFWLFAIQYPKAHCIDRLRTCWKSQQH